MRGATSSSSGAHWAKSGSLLTSIEPMLMVGSLRVAVKGQQDLPTGGQ